MGEDLAVGYRAECGLNGGFTVADELFGPYRLDELIGRGGMGEVWRAYDTIKERTVALKRLPSHLASDREFQARFRRESRLAAQLTEPHIIPIHDFGEIDGQLFIDMRLVEGVDLATLIAEHGPLPPARAVAIVAQVASALDAAHAAGLVHRDIKASNLLVTGSSRGEDYVYLVDFGIAHSAGGTSLTGTGATVGTLEYMAPERFLSGPGDHRVDIYSLGCLLYETLTAERPFSGEGLPALMYAQINGPIPEPSKHQTGIPQALDEVVARGMAKRPDDRYRTAGALATAAHRALDPETSPAKTKVYDSPATVEAGSPRAEPPASEPAGQSSGSATTPDRTKTFLTAGLIALGLVVLLLGVGLVSHFATDGPGGRSTGAAVGPVAAPDLERFYAQRLQWRGCADFAMSAEDRTTFGDPNYDCTYLQVPIDYAQPAGQTAQIAVLRQKATQPNQRIGSLLINPGGPGVSGIEAAAGVAKSLTEPLAQRFDLIGFDPRGVGASKPAIQCFTPAERDADRLDVYLDRSPQGVAIQEGKAKDYATKCEQKSGRDMLANAGTRDVVKDMDILRSALGDAKLTYLGYSYGTRVGYSYAEAFPQNVRALVLDGALDPDQKLIDRAVAQAEGFQKSFNAFAANCARQPGCPLGNDPDPKATTAAFRKLLEPLQTKAVPLAGGRQLSYNDAMTGTIQALYSEQLWEPLQRGLTELRQGQGRILMLLADLYEGRQQDGTYEFTLDAFASIGCVDDKPITDQAELLEADKRARELAPFRDDGRGPDPARDPCAFWPVPNTGEPHTPSVSGLPQVLVISVTNDPATPYQAGVNLAKGLGARLLTVEGNQHTVALQGHACVDEYVTRYLIDPNLLPADGARCKVSGQ